MSVQVHLYGSPIDLCEEIHDHVSGIMHTRKMGKLGAVIDFTRDLLSNLHTERPNQLHRTIIPRAVWITKAANRLGRQCHLFR